jgi:hypothetical protein
VLQYGWWLVWHGSNRFGSYPCKLRSNRTMWSLSDFLNNAHTFCQPPHSIGLGNSVKEKKNFSATVKLPTSDVEQQNHHNGDADEDKSWYGTRSGRHWRHTVYLPTLNELCVVTDTAAVIAGKIVVKCQFGFFSDVLCSSTVCATSCS